MGLREAYPDRTEGLFIWRIAFSVAAGAVIAQVARSTQVRQIDSTPVKAVA
jgi:hypothetical protein